MKVVVIDGQGGRLGSMLVEGIRSAGLDCQLTAIGTNSIAAASMLKAGADASASGENPVIVVCRDADVIIGPIGILAADALLGEITPAMAVAIGQSRAVKLLLPVNLCKNRVVGVPALSFSQLVTSTVEELKQLCQAELCH